MRVVKIVLSGMVLGLFAGPALALPSTPVLDRPLSAERCPVVKGDDPLDPKVVPNLTAGREELSNNHFQRAVAHFQPLAEDGNIEAQRLLGSLLLREGCNIPTDKAAGLRWLRKAAEKRDSEAQFLYGAALLHGNGTAEDDKGAFEWTKRAAAAGEPRADVQLGYLYFAGRGVKADPHEGVVWTVKGAEQGDPSALSNLAKVYTKGNGVPKDLHQAMFCIAAAMERVPPGQFQMSSRLAMTRYNITHQLSVEDVRTIEKEAEKWTPGPGSLAKVLADAAKGGSGNAASDAGRDMAEP